MANFLLALLAVLVAGLGARDQVQVAWAAAQRSPRAGVVAIALTTAVFSAALAGWAGSVAAPQLVPRARTILVAMALGLAATEMLVLRPRRAPQEPTASLGALAIVLLAEQVTDAARLLIFALAASSAVPQFAALGGMIGAGGTILIGWLCGAQLLALPLTWIRRALALLLAGIALYLVA